MKTPKEAEDKKRQLARAIAQVLISHSDMVLKTIQKKDAVTETTYAQS